MKKIDKTTINIGIAGDIETDTGQKTKTLVEQIESMENINVKAFYNKSLKTSRSVLKEAKILEKFVFLSSAKNKEKFLSKKIYTNDLQTFLNVEDLKIIIVTEINTEIAANVIFNSLLKRINVINLNAITEVTLGLIFKKLAISSKVIYSVGAGDEPAATLELVEYCRRLGLDIICAGKGKNNPLDIYCRPEDFEDKSRKMGVSSKNITSFVDGTKTMLEMAILSNATGFNIDKPGMHGPEINLKDLVKTFSLKKDGGILGKVPVIDYVIGDVAPGVFVVFTSRQKSIIEELNYLKMGEGPNFVLYKPYHLGNIEAPLSIYDVMLEERPTLTVKDKIITSVTAKAKKDLKPGDIIDTAGGYDFSGFAIDYKEMLNRNYVPIGLIEESEVKKNIEKDKIISFDDIECNRDNIIFNLWNLQRKI